MNAKLRKEDEKHKQFPHLEKSKIVDFFFRCSNWKLKMKIKIVCKSKSMWEYLNVRTHLSQTRLVQWTSRNLIKHMVCWRKVVSCLSCAAKIYTCIHEADIEEYKKYLCAKPSANKQTPHESCGGDAHTVHIPIKRAHTHSTIYHPYTDNHSLA